MQSGGAAQCAVSPDGHLLLVTEFPDIPMHNIIPGSRHCIVATDIAPQSPASGPARGNSLPGGEHSYGAVITL